MRIFFLFVIVSQISMWAGYLTAYWMFQSKAQSDYMEGYWDGIKATAKDSERGR